MIVRELLTRVGYTVDTRSESMAKKSFGKLKDLAGQLGLALSAGAVAIGFKRVVELASDVEETMNVVTTAFENQTDAVLQWAKDSGEAAGRSEFAMREYAATLGAVVGPTLGSAKATAELSTNMAQLAVDLGSFFNATDEDALMALRSGLIGQAEPLLRFGVAMNVASLQAFALKEGITKAYKDMTEAQKITLRYQFILANTAKAQGDAARTSAGYANQTKRLQGNIKTIAVAIGKQFLPGMADLLATINFLIKDLKGPLVSALRLITAPIKLIGATVAGLAVGLTQLGWIGKTAFAAMLGAVLAAKAPFIITGAIIGAVILAALLIVEDLWMALTEGKGVIAGVGNEFMALFDETGSAFLAFGGFLVNIIDFWIDYIFGFPNATERAFLTVRDALSRAGAWIADWFDWLSREAAVKITALQQTLLDLPNSIWEAIKGIIPGIKELLKIIDLAGGIGSFFDTIAGNLGFDLGIGGRGGGGNVNANQTIEVNVNAPGADGPAIAGAVAPAVGRAAAEGNRRTAQQLLAGGVTP